MNPTALRCPYCDGPLPQVSNLDEGCLCSYCSSPIRFEVIKTTIQKDEEMNIWYCWDMDAAIGSGTLLDYQDFSGITLQHGDSLELQFEINLYATVENNVFKSSVFGPDDSVHQDIDFVA